jgi:hypothetical protein
MLKFKLQRKIDSTRVAKALGAEPVGIRSPRPMDIFDVRESLKKVLAPKVNWRSNGIKTKER